MRALSIFALTWLAAAQLTAAPKTSRDPLQATGCSRELRDHYGEQVSFMLVSRRNSRQGLVLKVAVRDASADSGKWAGHYATCLVSRGGKGRVTVEAEGGKASRAPD